VPNKVGAVVKKESKSEAKAVDQHIGAQIRLARMEIKMSQETLGNKLGLTFQQVQKYEKGANRVGGSRLWAISQILGKAPAYFFEGLDSNGLKADIDDTDVETVMDFIRSNEGIKLATRFRKITNPKVRSKLIDLIGTIASKN